MSGAGQFDDDDPPSGEPDESSTAAADRKMPSIAQTYDRIRNYIRHEDYLIVERTKWLITIQSFLLAAGGVGVGKMIDIQKKETSTYDPLFALIFLICILVGIAVVGIQTARIAEKAINAADNAIASLKRHWDNFLSDNYFDRSLLRSFPYVTGGGSHTAEKDGIYFAKEIAPVFVNIWMFAIFVLTVNFLMILLSLYR